METDGRVSRITFPTASFSLRQQQIEWIAEEASRRGVKKSVLVRDVIDDAMTTTPEEIGSDSEELAVAS